MSMAYNPIIKQLVRPNSLKGKTKLYAIYLLESHIK